MTQKIISFIVFSGTCLFVLSNSQKFFDHQVHRLGAGDIGNLYSTAGDGGPTYNLGVAELAPKHSSITQDAAGDGGPSYSVIARGIAGAGDVNA